jgi:hypothetical protein
MPKIGLRLTRTLLRTGVVRTRVCSSIDAIEHCGSLDAFARARDRCAALKEILIPDRIWPEYEDFCSADPDEACHAPVTYLAFKRRHLARLTEPIHLFCMKGGAPHPSLTNQYKNDLVERWMIAGVLNNAIGMQAGFWVAWRNCYLPCRCLKKAGG